MKLLATLREPVDQFFEHTTVNDPDPATRERRLRLLAGIRDVMHRVADFSKIEG
jgi:glycyl-tRNA synthetase beta chain